LTLLTFYALTGKRRTRRPVLSIDDVPSDWFELKNMLTEVMTIVYARYGFAEAEVTLESHKPGKFTFLSAPYGYRTKPVRYKREYEAYFKVLFNPKMGSLEVSRAAFSWSLNQLAEEFYYLEKGVRYHVPPLIPKKYRQSAQEKPRVLLTLEPSGPYSYSKKPQRLYGLSEEEKPHLSYSYKPRMSYGKRFVSK